METTPHSPLWEGKASFQMVDVGEKAVTRRVAIAQGKIKLSPSSFEALLSGKNPKGNVLAMAEVSGILMAKRTADFIPLCHPLPIDQIKLRFELSAVEHVVAVFCEVATHAKTGVEMEALAGVNGALLTIYDLSKAVDPTITISEIRLNVKEGGKSGKWTHPEYHEPGSIKSPSPSARLQGIAASVVTVSDRVSQGKAEDRSGPALRDFLMSEGASLLDPVVVSDDIDAIVAALRNEIFEKRARLVITTGGTGLAPRDVTPEAISRVCEKMVPGFGELLRQKGAASTAMSWLSRSVAGTLSQALIIALPGSPRAVKEGTSALAHLLPHALHILQGGKHD